MVTRGGQTWAMEIKSGRGAKLPGMDLFRRRYPEARGLLIGGNGIPLDEFFTASPQEWFT